MAYSIIETATESDIGVWTDFGATESNVVLGANWYIAWRLQTDETPTVYQTPTGTRSFYDGALLTANSHPLNMNPVGSTHVLTLSVVMDWQDGDMGISSLPSSRRLHDLGTFTVTPPDTTYSMTDPLLAGINIVRSHGDWNGELWFVMRGFVGTAIWSTDASTTLTTTQINPETGLSGSEYIRDRQRGIASGLTRDFKTGELIATDTAVVDGFTGQLVHPDNWDPS